MLLIFMIKFPNHVGFDCDQYLDLHEIGIPYSEAMEDTITSEGAQGLFEIAAAKFQEMAALSLYTSLKRVPGSLYWKSLNLHMYGQKTNIKWQDVGSKKILIKLKPYFYEGLLALGRQQFEQAKLSWYYLIGSKVELEMGTCAGILELYNKVDDNMERGMEM